MKKRYIYAIGFVIMLILNGVLIFLMLKGPKLPPPSRPMKSTNLAERISKDLQLNPEQKKTYEDLAKSHRIAMEQLDEEQKELIKSYLSSLVKEDSDLPLILEKIKEVEGSKITITYQHFEKLKALCNDEQKDRFELIMKDLIAVLVGQEKGNRPPPPR